MPEGWRPGSGVSTHRPVAANKGKFHYFLHLLIKIQVLIPPAMVFFSRISGIYENIFVERNTREKIPLNILTLQFDLEISEKKQNLSKQRKIRSGLTRRKDPESPSTPVSDNSVKFDIFNQKKLSIAEIKRNHKIHRTPTKEKVEPVANENEFGDSDDYELYFTQKTNRKHRNKVKIFSPDVFLISDENETRDDKNIDNVTGTEQSVSIKNKMKNQENSLRIFLPLCKTLSVAEDQFWYKQVLNCDKRLREEDRVS